MSVWWHLTLLRFSCFLHLKKSSSHRQEFFVGLVQLIDRLVGVPVDAVEAELLEADGAVTWQGKLSVSLRWAAAAGAASQQQPAEPSAEC